jgi:hypothetical protein
MLLGQVTRASFANLLCPLTVTDRTQCPSRWQCKTRIRAAHARALPAVHQRSRSLQWCCMRFVLSPTSKWGRATTSDYPTGALPSAPDFARQHLEGQVAHPASRIWSAGAPPAQRAIASYVYCGARSASAHALSGQSRPVGS